ncbi:MAG: segregation and condensation protein [Actinomycetota bacterium]|jgi:segregation and condensation protein A|nr:segregation and condensation protein [Actinomycetota bacterium]
MSLEVKLEAFEGPIELLLHLITRQRVSIYDVSLSTITEEYLAAVDGIEELDLEAATGFLVIAATLLELKSLRLLPERNHDATDPTLLEERDALLAKLVEVSTFREAGAWLGSRLSAGEGFVGRAVTLEDPYAALTPDPVDRLRVQDLAVAAARVLAERPIKEIDISHVTPIRASVRDAIAELAGALQRDGAGTFAGLCLGVGSRIEVVVRFLALLELFKAGAVELGQAGRFGDITAEWTGDVQLEVLLDEVDEYGVPREVA